MVPKQNLNNTTYVLTCQGLDGSAEFSNDGVRTSIFGSSSNGKDSGNSTVQIKTPGQIIYQEVAP